MCKPTGTETVTISCVGNAISYRCQLTLAVSSMVDILSTGESKQMHHGTNDGLGLVAYSNRDD